MSDFKITVRNSGPLRLEGDITLLESASTPLCDGSHNRSGFASACEAAELPPPKPKA